MSLLKKRLNFIDVARSYAIALAIFSHAMIDFEGWGIVPEVDNLRFFTRTATPLFVFMFGMMLELVYVRYAARDTIKAVAPRLFKRSLQCYIGYALTVLAGIVGGYMTVLRSLGALAFLANSYFGIILRMYAVILALSPAIIWIRLRYGVQSLIVLLAVIWGADFLLFGYFEEMTTARPWAQWVGIFLGSGPSPEGPSIWHGLTFVFTGMFVASGLRNWQEAGLAPFYRYGTILLVITLSGVLYLVFENGLQTVANSYVEYSTYRRSNDIGYYLIGTSTSVVLLFILSAIVPQSKLPEWTRFPLEFGRSSLLSYSLANICLNLIPPETVKAHSALIPIFASLSFLSLMLLMVNWKVLLPERVLVGR